MDKIVVYCGTRNVYPVMEVAAKSLLYNTPVDRVYFLTEDDTFPSQLPDIITIMNVSGQTWFDPDGPNYNSDWTYMAFMRLAFTKIFPDYSTVLYLDTDTLVLQDISELMSAPFGDALFSMVREDTAEIPLEICHAFAVTPNGINGFQSDNPRPRFCIRPYYNSGVMLMNLHRLRESGMDDRLIREINSTRYTYPDQDAINLLCHDQISPAPQEYNVIPALRPDYPQDKIRIKHYASDKPLWKSGLWQQYRRLSWETVEQKQMVLRTNRNS